MKISAKDILTRIAQDPQPRVIRPEKQQDEVEMSPDTGPRKPDTPQEEPQEPQQLKKPQTPSENIQTITQSLLNNYFSDEKIGATSEDLQKLIPFIGVDNVEKFIKMYTEWIKATMALKAHVLSLSVLATPQAVLEDRMKNLLEMITEPSDSDTQIPVT